MTATEKNKAHSDDEDYREELPAFGKSLTKSAKSICSKKLLARRLPIVRWLPKYRPPFIISDFVAGVTVGITAISQCIAYAIIANLPPQYGLYSAFMGCFVYIFLGSCKASTIGPTAITAIMTQPYVTGKNPEFAVLLTFLKGCLTFLFGILNLGFLVQFFSSAVISGFTTAAAITIASGQMKNLLGYGGSDSVFLESIENFVKNVQHLRLGDTILGVAAMLVIFSLKKLGQHKGDYEGVRKYLALGRNVVVDITGMILAYIFFLNDKTPFRLTGEITSGLPQFKPPPFSTQCGNETYTFSEMISELGTAPLMISFISILEAITVATIYVEKNEVVDATQEMIAVGACNIMGSFVSSMPVTSSFTRSAINNASGVRSSFSGIFTGSMVLLALGLLTSYFYYLPKATVAAVIISAMLNTMEFGEIIHTWKTKRVDMIPMMATLLSCLFIDLDMGIIIGVVVNLFIVLYTNSRPSVDSQIVKVGEHEMMVLTPNRDIIFSSVDNFRFQVSKKLLENPKVDTVVFEGTFMQNLDSTAAKKMANFIENLNYQEKEVILWNWKHAVFSVLVRFDSKLKNLHFKGDTLDDLELELKTRTAQKLTITT